MLHLVYYVPLADADQVNNALFAAGAGKIGNYDSCCWMVEGTGQFRAGDSANPTIGAINQLERIPEARVEMVLSEDKQDAVRAALIQAHPYETPAYHFVRIES